ncbi:MAG: O-antigen ligase [Polaribacter sp.]|jgi:O-antigen ligase|tara:strand:+ start:4326 stop:5564 length:1239 start_codon:yes stop_codon:yes gene_type:complete
MLRKEEDKNYPILELLLILYVLSGYIKVFLILYNISIGIDITLLLALILVFKVFLSKKIILKSFFTSIVLFLVFFIWMIITIIYSTSNGYLFNKIFLFSTNIVAFVIPLLLFSKIEIKSLLNKFVLISTPLGICFIAFILPKLYFNEIYNNASQAYLTVSLFSGMNILLLLLLKVKLFKNSYINLLFIILNIAVLILSGGRGGLVLAFLVLTIFGFFKLKLKLKQLKLILKSISLIILFGFIIGHLIRQTEYVELFERSIARLELLTEFNGLNSGGGGKSIEGRVGMLNFSFDKIVHSPTSLVFGYGIGSFWYEYTGIDGRGYPHNLVLEILFELGLIGLLIFIIFSGVTLKHFKYTALSWIVFYLLLNSLKSSSLVDLRILFFMFSLVLIDGSNNFVLKKKGKNARNIIKN